MLREFTIFPRNNPIYLHKRNTHDIILCKKTSPTYGKLQMYIFDKKAFITIFLKIGFWSYFMWSPQNNVRIWLYKSKILWKTIINTRNISNLQPKQNDYSRYYLVFLSPFPPRNTTRHFLLLLIRRWGCESEFWPVECKWMKVDTTCRIDP